MNSDQRIPSLDGFRAIAILLVVYWHLQFSSREFPRVAFDWGTLGVFIFFVISGFLITTLLQRERERTQSISLTKFYIRRVFRIFPPLLFFLACVGILTRLGLSNASGRALLFSLSFLRNYHPGPYRILHHLWSLSVEEQFYLIWPFLFSTLTKRTVCRLLTGVIVAVPIIRVVTLLWFGEKYVWHTEQVADGLAWGCLLAIKQADLRATAFYQWFSRSHVRLLLPCLIVAAAYTSPALLYEGIGKTGIFLCVALGMDMVMMHSQSLAGRILNFAPLMWIGKISYSLYLWQQVFLIVKAEDQPYAWFPMNIALAAMFAIASYYVIEKPAIQFGRAIVARGEKRSVPVNAAVVSDLGAS